MQHYIPQIQIFYCIIVLHFVLCGFVLSHLGRHTGESNRINNGCIPVRCAVPGGSSDVVHSGSVAQLNGMGPNIDVISHACAFPATTNQNIHCEKGPINYL